MWNQKILGELNISAVWPWIRVLFLGGKREYPNTHFYAVTLIW